MALFKKRREKVISEAEREREELQRERRELHEKLLGETSGTSYGSNSEYNNIDNGYRDMRGIDEIKDIIESSSRKPATTPPINNMMIEKYACSGCGAVFRDAWDRCPRCDGRVEKRKNQTSPNPSESRGPTEERGLGFELGRAPEPTPSRARFKERKREREPDIGRFGRIGDTKSPSHSEENIFSKEVLAGSLYKQDLPASAPQSAVPSPAPGRGGGPQPSVPVVRKVKKVKKVKKQALSASGARAGRMGVQKRQSSSQTCPHCGKTLSKAPPGGWKFCVHCGEKM